MTNLELAGKVVDWALLRGVRNFVVCGGSRNTPLIAVIAALIDEKGDESAGRQRVAQASRLPLSGASADAKTGTLGGLHDGATRDDVKVFSFFEERSAAFFALGLSRRAGAPVAVVTTSGTAVSELLPATIEAHYSGVPLLLVTADRPARFRGTGAPQTIQQPGIFSTYVENSFDLDSDRTSLPNSWSARAPLHLNVAFEEPLLEGEIPGMSSGHSVTVSPSHSSRLPEPSKHRIGYGKPAILPLETVRRWRQPLLILGALSDNDRPAVREFALKFAAPIYAEPLSGLREDAQLRPLLITSGERILQMKHFDGILRLGGIPALRFWRELEEKGHHLPVVSISDLPFPGLSHGELISAELSSILPSLDVVARTSFFPFAHDRDRATSIQHLLDAEPQSELAMVRGLSRLVRDPSLIFLGNSLPIREWDLVADGRAQISGLPLAGVPQTAVIPSNTSPTRLYGANRGANGIDGELSTFFGQCLTGRDNWVVVGDLTALYDLAAPWVIPQLDPALTFRIVIINNGGGRIFSRVPALAPMNVAVRRRLVETSHQIGFEAWATMWNLPYQQWTEVPALPDLPSRCILELLPDVEANSRAWTAYDALWS